MNKIPEKLIIKNAIVKIEDFLSIGGFGFLLFFAVQDIQSIWTLLMIGLFIFFVYNFFKRLRNRNPQIIIDERGIEFCEEKDFYNWDKIKYAYIKSETTGYGKNSSTIDYFYIVTNKTDIKKRIDDYKYSSKVVKETVEHFSGRDIGDYSDQFRDEMMEILNGNKFTKEIIKLFSAYQTRMIVSTLILFFGIIGISVYFQVTSDFKYCVGVGFVISILTLLFYSQNSENNFKQKRYISDLTSEQFDKIAIKHQLKYPKKQMNGYMIFFGITAIVIFVISYYATKG